ncbi:unnamed protein product [Cylicocyclus nassatus]|uniref:Uncharacterized protein n=1 Tax=Cylicocyclus nassatus TaxID=53992 RepID=A0AA36M5U8_CYLNA|nr:unnamed protein product [Cylicocyclus nassatus]
MLKATFQKSHEKCNAPNGRRYIGYHQKKTLRLVLLKLGKNRRVTWCTNHILITNDSTIPTSHSMHFIDIAYSRATYGQFYWREEIRYDSNRPQVFPKIFILGTLALEILPMKAYCSVYNVRYVR